MFQSTPPHGRRLSGQLGGESTVLVSIHASAREATVGDDAPSIFPRFQSTPPHGRRPIALSRPRADWRFNPRLRTGGDGGSVNRRKSVTYNAICGDLPFGRPLALAPLGAQTRKARRINTFREIADPPGNPWELGVRATARYGLSRSSTPGGRRSRWTVTS